MRIQFSTHTLSNKRSALKHKYKSVCLDRAEIKGRSLVQELKLDRPELATWMSFA